MPSDLLPLGGIGQVSMDQPLFAVDTHAAETPYYRIGSPCLNKETVRGIFMNFLQQQIVIIRCRPSTLGFAFICFGVSTQFEFICIQFGWDTCFLRRPLYWTLAAGHQQDTSRCILPFVSSMFFLFVFSAIFFIKDIARYFVGTALYGPPFQRPASLLQSILRILYQCHFILTSCYLSM